MFIILRKTTLILILATAAAVLYCFSVQASDPLAGIWELNLEKSKFNPGPLPKSRTRVYEVTGQQEKMVSKTIDAAGNETVMQFSANRDGKDYPYEGWPLADTISVTPIDTFTASYTMKKAGVIVVTGTRVVSSDGKMMTIPVKFTNPKGQLVDNIEVYDKR